MLDVYGRLTGTRPPSGDAMLLLSGRPTRGEAPPFQPHDSLLWLRLRVAYLGAVWRLRSSGAATTLQPQQVAMQVVEEVISTLTTAVKRDWHRVGRDIRVGLCGAVPSTWFKSKDPELDAAHFDQLWPEASGGWFAKQPRRERRGGQEGAEGRPTHPPLHTRSPRGGKPGLAMQRPGVAARFFAVTLKVQGLAQPHGLSTWVITDRTAPPSRGISPRLQAHVAAQAELKLFRAVPPASQSFFSVLAEPLWYNARVRMKPAAREAAAEQGWTHVRHVREALHSPQLEGEARWAADLVRACLPEPWQGMVDRLQPPQPEWERLRVGPGVGFVMRRTPMLQPSHWVGPNGRLYPLAPTGQGPLGAFLAEEGWPGSQQRWPGSTSPATGCLRRSEPPTSALYPPSITWRRRRLKGRSKEEPGRLAGEWGGQGGGAGSEGKGVEEVEGEEWLLETLTHAFLLCPAVVPAWEWMLDVYGRLTGTRPPSGDAMLLLSGRPTRGEAPPFQPHDSLLWLRLRVAYLGAVWRLRSSGAATTLQPHQVAMQVVEEVISTLTTAVKRDWHRVGRDIRVGLCGAVPSTWFKSKDPELDAAHFDQLWPEASGGWFAKQPRRERRGGQEGAEGRPTHPPLHTRSPRGGKPGLAMQRPGVAARFFAVTLKVQGLAQPHGLSTWVITDRTAPPSRGISPRLQAHVAAQAELKLFRAVPPASQSFFSVLAEPLWYNARVRMNPAAREAAAEQGWTHVRHVREALHSPQLEGEARWAADLVRACLPEPWQGMVDRLQPPQPEWERLRVGPGVGFVMRRTPMLQPSHWLLETLTHAFLLCPGVVPAWEWMLDVYGRLTGTRPPSGDAMLLLSGRPTRGEAPPFQPHDSLLWLRLRVAYLGAVWRLRSSGAATTLQPQQVAMQVVEEVISTLTTAVKRDWHRVGRDIRVGLCGAVPSTWFKSKDPELDAAHFDQLWPEASGGWFAKQPRMERRGGQEGAEGRPTHPPLHTRSPRGGKPGLAMQRPGVAARFFAVTLKVQGLAQPHGLSTWVITDRTAPPSRGISPRLQAHVAAQAELKLFRAVPPASQSFFSVLAEPLWYNARVRMNPAAREAAAEQGWTHVRHVREALHSPQLEGEARWAADLVRACLPEPWQGMVDRLQPPQPEWERLRVGPGVGFVMRRTPMLQPSHWEQWLLETLTHAFLLCPAVVPAWEWMLDVYGRLTGTRPPSGDAMLLLSGRPTRGEAPPFQPHDSLLWLRLRAAYLGAVWRLRSSGAATTLQPQQVAMQVVEEVISTLTTAVKRDWHRVGRDIRVGLCGAVPSTWFKPKDPELDAAHFDQLWPEASGGWFLAVTLNVQGLAQPHKLQALLDWAADSPAQVVSLQECHRAESVWQWAEAPSGAKPAWRGQCFTLLAPAAPKAVWFCLLADPSHGLSTWVITDPTAPPSRGISPRLQAHVAAQAELKLFRAVPPASQSFFSVLAEPLWYNARVRMKPAAREAAAEQGWTHVRHEQWLLETLTHAFLLCPAVVPAWEWMLDVYGRLTGTRPPSGDAMLLLNGRPTRGEAPPFQPHDSLLWLRLRAAYLGAVWRLRSSRAATTLQPQQVAMQVVEEVISTLTTAVKRDWHRVGRDIRVGLCGAVPSTWFKSKDPELDAAHFDQLWPEASGGWFLAVTLNVQGLAQPHKLQALIDWAADSPAQVERSPNSSRLYPSKAICVMPRGEGGVGLPDLGVTSTAMLAKMLAQLWSPRVRPWQPLTHSLLADPSHGLNTWVITDPTAPPSRGISPRLQAHVAAQAELKLFRAVPPASQSFFSVLAEPLWYNARVRMNPAAREAAAEQGWTHVRHVREALHSPQLEREARWAADLVRACLPEPWQGMVDRLQPPQPEWERLRVGPGVGFVMRRTPMLQPSHWEEWLLETLTHAFLLCPAVVPAWEWMLDVYGRLTGTRPPSGDAMLLLSGRPTRGEAPPFQPHDSLLWLRLRAAYLGAVWRLRSSRAATTLQPQQVAMQVVEEVISTLTTAVKRDWHRVGRDIRVGLCGAVPSTWFKSKDPELDAAHFDQLWPEASGGWFLAVTLNVQGLAQPHKLQALLDWAADSPAQVERSPNSSRLYPSKAICVMPRGEGGVGLPDLGVTSTAMLAKMLAQLWSPRVRPWQPLTHSLLADPSHGLSTWVITDPTAPPSRGISPRLQAHVAAQAELKLFRAVPPASQSFFSVLAEPLWYNARVRMNPAAREAAAEQGWTHVRHVREALHSPQLEREARWAADLVRACLPEPSQGMVDRLQPPQPEWERLRVGPGVGFVMRRTPMLQPSHWEEWLLETLTHAFLLCPAVVPAWEWMLDVYGRLTGTRPPSGDAMLLLSGRPTRGEPPPFQPHDSLLWLRLRAAYLGAVWRLRSSGAATTLQPQQVAMQVVEEVISTLTTAVKRDWHRVGRDIRVGLCGAVPSTWFKSKDPELDAAHFDQLWPEASGGWFAKQSRRERRGGQEGAEGRWPVPFSVEPGPGLLRPSPRSLSTAQKALKAAQAWRGKPPELEGFGLTKDSQLDSALMGYAIGSLLLPRNHPTSAGVRALYTLPSGKPRPAAPLPRGPRTADPNLNNVSEEDANIIIASIANAGPDGAVFSAFTPALRLGTAMTIRDIYLTEDNKNSKRTPHVATHLGRIGHVHRTDTHHIMQLPVVPTLITAYDKMRDQCLCHAEVMKELKQFIRTTLQIKRATISVDERKGDLASFDVTITINPEEAHSSLAFIGLVGAVIASKGPLSYMQCVQGPFQGRPASVVIARPLLSIAIPPCHPVRMSVQYHCRMTEGSPAAKAPSSINARGYRASSLRGDVQYAISKALEASVGQEHAQNTAFLLCSSIVSIKDVDAYLDIGFAEASISSAIQQLERIKIDATDSLSFSLATASSSQATGMSLSLSCAAMQPQALATSIQKLAIAYHNKWGKDLQLTALGGGDLVNAASVTASGELDVHRYVGIFSGSKIRALTGVQLPQIGSGTKQLLIFVPGSLAQQAALTFVMAEAGSTNKPVLDSTGTHMTVDGHAPSHMGPGKPVGYPTFAAHLIYQQLSTAASTAMSAAHRVAGTEVAPKIGSIMKTMSPLAAHHLQVGKAAHATQEEADPTPLQKVLDTVPPLITAMLSYYSQPSGREAAKAAIKAHLDTMAAHIAEGTALASATLPPPRQGQAWTTATSSSKGGAHSRWRPGRGGVNLWSRHGPPPYHGESPPLPA
ncbi:hypothetical protein QJQ45_009101 [Haematococcus lacustris]|nr:hypothetical protein QJQ45_009101 [Haematococcus lacustris]